MAAAEQRIFSSEESLKAINERATKDGDEFILKVFRRTHLASPPTVIATFEGANVQHFNSPELWLPSLSGGGKYQLQGYHQTDLNRPVASFIGFTVDNEEPREVDLAAPKRPDWRGPAKLSFPKEAQARQQADMPLYDVRTPPGPGLSDSATRSTWARQPGGGVVRQNYEDPGVEAFGPRAHALESERRKLESEKLEAERERHKREAEQEKRAHDAEMKALETKLEMRFQMLQKPTGPDPMVEFMKMQADDRRAAEAQRRADQQAERERQDRIDARAAEERRFERERQDKIDARLAEERRFDRERMDKIFEKLAERKPERDPLEMIEKFSNIVAKKGDNSDMLMKSMHNMMEVQSTVMDSTMGFVEHVSRMNLGGGGDEEPAWVKGIDRLMKGVGSFVKAKAGGPVFPQQPQIAAQAQAQAAQQAQAQQAAQQAQAAQPRPPTTNAEAPIIDQIIGGIYAHYDPRMVAKALISYYQDDSIQKAIAEAGGDPEKALLTKLGNWPDAAPQNREYLKKLLEELENALQAAGYFAEEPKKSEAKDKADDEDGDDDEEADTDESDDEGDETEE